MGCRESLFLWTTRNVLSQIVMGEEHLLGFEWLVQGTTKLINFPVEPTISLHQRIIFISPLCPISAFLPVHQDFQTSPYKGTENAGHTDFLDWIFVVKYIFRRVRPFQKGQYWQLMIKEVSLPRGRLQQATCLSWTPQCDWPKWTLLFSTKSWKVHFGACYWTRRTPSGIDSLSRETSDFNLQCTRLGCHIQPGFHSVASCN